MMAPALVLYHFPNACSQVTLFALEKAGVPHEVRLVDLPKGEQKTPAYLAVSPLGKVPVLLIDGTPLYENIALITYLGEAYPNADLFPDDTSPIGRAQRVSALSFCSGTLHPIVRGIMNPGRLTDGDVEGVRSHSSALADLNFAYAEARLEKTGWWFDERSIIDVYLNWTLTVARMGGYDLSHLPALDGLRDRLMVDPVFARVVAGEKQFLTELEARRQAVS